MNVKGKLYQIKKEVAYLQKTKDAFHGDKIVPEEEVFAAIKPQLEKHALLCEPVLEGDPQMSYVAPEKKFFYLQRGAMVFSDTETNETHKIPWTFTGSSNDASFAFGIAMTYCERIFWLKWLMAKTGLDPEETAPEDTKKASLETKATSPKAKKAQSVPKANQQTLIKVEEGIIRIGDKKYPYPVIAAEDVMDKDKAIKTRYAFPDEYQGKNIAGVIASLWDGTEDGILKLVTILNKEAKNDDQKQTQIALASILLLQAQKDKKEKT